MACTDFRNNTLVLKSHHSIHPTTVYSNHDTLASSWRKLIWTRILQSALVVVFSRFLDHNIVAKLINLTKLMFTKSCQKKKRSTQRFFPSKKLLFIFVRQLILNSHEAKDSKLMCCVAKRNSRFFLANTDFSRKI